jgi:hypothetical protein
MSVCSWLDQQPGVPLSIYYISDNANTALQQAMTPSNILADFQKVRLLPFENSIFVDYEFLPSGVTDRPDPTTARRESTVTAGIPPDILEINGTASCEPSTSFALHPAVPQTSTIPSPQLTSMTNGKSTAVKFVSP